MSYTPPLRDIRFVLEHVVDLAGLASLDRFTHATPDVVAGVLEEAGRFFADVVVPVGRTGDRQGSRLTDDGTVVTPDGFKEAYRRYIEAGWGGVQFDPEFGGGGFPWVVGTAVQEMLTASDVSFSMCPLLTQGAIELLAAYGSDHQRRRYLEKLITGEWTATMNLTEPEAGSDVGALRTRAEPAGDGTWRITGSKIFITFGEHDLAPNIVHLVLARTPGAPPGTKGISCFAVPKYLVREDGSLGERNDLRCVSLEHKMGIHASPTCAMAYGDQGGAVGELVGEENEGMRYMFTMMNNARLAVGVQGLALAERAYQLAVVHAQERRQGRAPGSAGPGPSPIVEHPDVRRMLLTSKASVEAMRCLLYRNAECIDVSRAHPDEAVRSSNKELADLLTPLSKAWCTDVGVEVTSLAVQVHGGMGYVEETGAAQLYREARIAPIYEGTNGIQAIDLVMRKLPVRGGAVVREQLASIRDLDGDLAAAGDELAGARSGLAAGVEAAERATEWLLGRGAAAPVDVLAGATPYLRLLATVVAGGLLARSAVTARRLLDRGEGDADVLSSKIATARFFAEQIVPQAAGLLPAVTAGAGPLFAVEPKQLGP